MMLTTVLEVFRSFRKADCDERAFVLTAVGIDPKKVMTSPIGRTLTLSEGKVIKALLG